MNSSWQLDFTRFFIIILVFSSAQYVSLRQTKLVKVYRRTSQQPRHRFEERFFERGSVTLERSERLDSDPSIRRLHRRGSNGSQKHSGYRHDRSRRSPDDAAEQADPEGTSNLPDYDRIAFVYHIFSITFLSILVTKYIIAMALEHSNLSEYYYIDCYLIGRIAFTGSMLSATKYWFFSTIVQQLIWEAAMIIFKPKIKIDCLEFVLTNLSKIVAWEAREDELFARRYSRNSVHLNFDDMSIIDFRRMSRLSDIDYYNHDADFSNPSSRFTHEEPSIHTSISHLKVHYLHHGTDVFLLRPNRTAQVWMLYQRYSFYFFAFFLTSMSFWTLITMNLAIHGSATRRGFELTNNLCVEWIISLNRTSNSISSKYDHIYVPHDDYPLNAPVISSVIPLENLLVNSLYHKLRIALTVFESSFIIFNGSLQFFFQLYTCFIMVADSVIHIRHCKRKLKRYIQSISWRLDGNNSEFLSMNVVQNTQLSSDIGDDISTSSICRIDKVMQLQALVYDLFYQMDRNNGFISIFMPHLLMTWLYTGATSCFLQLTPTFSGQTGMVLECFSFWLYCGVFVVIVLCAISIVESYSRELYKYIATAMTYDYSIFTTKLNWVVLMSQYYPIPYYCYKLLGKTSISFVFILQVRNLTDQ